MNRRRQSSRPARSSSGAEVLGEAPEDPLLLFSVLYGFWAASFVMFKGDASCDLAARS